MIAQELALSEPARVRKLVLGCTQCGGPKAVRPGREVRRVFLKFASKEKRIAAFTPFLYDERTPRERIEQDRAVLRGNSAAIVQRRSGTSLFPTPRLSNSIVRKCRAMMERRSRHIAIEKLSPITISRGSPSPSSSHQMRTPLLET